MKPMKHNSGLHAAASFPYVRHLWLLFLLCYTATLLQSCKKFDPNPPPVGKYDLSLITEGLTSPIVLTEAPDRTGRLFVAEQSGKVWILQTDGSPMADPFLDISGKLITLSPFYDERGLLGFAFHPDYQTNGKCYVFYTAPPRPGGPEPGASWNNLTRVSEFRVSAANPNKIDMASERVVFEADHPQGNHNGGTIAFGPDGYLYISIGDGGGSDDVGPGHVTDWYDVNEGGNGQDIEHNLMGDILRIDVNSMGKEGYGIPADNPFAGKEGMEEIYAYGFRNPYRFSFDMGGAHALYAGDAGQALYEEIDIVKKGGNYGWNVKEGTHCFSTDNNLEERASCPVETPDGIPLIDPVIEMPNANNPKGGIATAVVGGNVYRGKTIPFLYGRYIFGTLSDGGDSPAGKLYLGMPTNSGLWNYEEMELKSFPGSLGQYIKSFGQSLDGEVYVLTSSQIGPQGNTGKVYKLVFNR